MSALVDAHGVPFHQLATEPTRHSGEPEAGEGQAQGKGLGCSGIISSEQPAQAEEDEDYGALPRPWTAPTFFARVPFGMAVQSMVPKGAATSPPMIPAAIIQ